MLLGCVLVAVTGVAWIVWTLIPPRDVVGSTLSGFWSEDRRRRMLVDEAEQEYTLFGGER